MKNRCFLISLLLLISLSVMAQQPQGVIYGKVVDENRKPLELVHVAVIGKTEGTYTDENGQYELDMPANALVKVAFSYLGFRREIFTLQLQAGQRRRINVQLKRAQTDLPGAVIETRRRNDPGMVTIPPKVATEIPAASGNAVEELVKRTGLGVSASSELSSQYSVRGGNYDENLVYVNDIEIYRPFLVSSGEQEGLSFINSDLVKKIEFSAGGFEAKYGDKMSSVLDITYKDPSKFEAGFQTSLLGASAYVQDASSSRTFSYVAGIRYKTSRYMLNALETSGEYQPSFFDFQGLMHFKPGENFRISLLTNVSENNYEMIPESRETRFGTLEEALQFRVYFDGREQDRFRTMNTALSFRYTPTDPLELKLIASLYNADEAETFDIRGQYWLDELETDLGADDFGSAALNRGVGTYQNHARNYLQAKVFALKHVGSYQDGSSRNLHWGLKVQREMIEDEMWEYTMLDSAGYALPRPPDVPGDTQSSKEYLEMKELITSETDLASTRISGHLQNQWDFGNDSLEYQLTAGVRFQHWSMNDELLLSPRASLDIIPAWKHDITYRLAAGIYYQPPFFREMRDFNGEINPDIKAQRSVHIVAGQYWNFQAWNRPFRFATELYYKQLDNLIPYEVENVRIRYYARNIAHGYATGIDFKVNGEFVPGLQSWAGLSLMSTRENIEGDQYYVYYNDEGEQIYPGYSSNNTPADSSLKKPGYVPRPTDRRVNFNVYFQDFLPRNPAYKMHLNLVFGTGLPFGPPSHERYKDTLRMKPYRRVDIGFSRQIKGKDQQLSAKSPFRNFKSIWITLEVFNLLQNNNTISYMWISDAENRQYAIPKYLTSRRINLRLVARF
ncbi:MAG: carboxypeptidase-like regulatory domain-containing protein [Bacteroidales bacterium]